MLEHCRAFRGLQCRFEPTETGIEPTSQFCPVRLPLGEVAPTSKMYPLAMRTTRFALPLLLALPAIAQTIAWGPVQPTLGPTDVDLTGTLVVARNLHAAGGTVSPTVNGVLFTGAFAPSGWTNASTNALFASTTGDAGYDQLLSAARATSFGAAANPTGWGAIRIDNLVALTVGRNYLIQCWFTDQRLGTATNTLYDRVMTLSSAVGAATLSGGEVQNLGTLVQGPLSGPLDADPDDSPAIGPTDVLFGSHCTGTFTRVNGTDPIWLLVRGTHPDSIQVLRPHLTALQIRELPAGSVYATASPFGVGCTAAAPLTLATGQRPLVNSLFSATTGNITPTTPFGAVTLGLNVAVPPVDLTNLGMTGCFQYGDVLTSLLYLPLGQNSAVTTIVVPNLVGLPLVLQSFNYDPAAALTPLGAVSSNALRVVCGDL